MIFKIKNILYKHFPSNDEIINKSEHTFPYDMRSDGELDNENKGIILLDEMHSL